MVKQKKQKKQKRSAEDKFLKEVAKLFKPPKYFKKTRPMHYATLKYAIPIVAGVMRRRNIENNAARTITNFLKKSKFKDLTK